MEFHRWESKWLQPVCQLWNTQLGDRFPMREELLQQNSLDDPHLVPEGSWVAVEASSQRPVGIVIAKRWREEDSVTWGKGMGWIQTLLVDRGYRRKGVGTALLERAEKALTSWKVDKIALGSDWWHYFPGVPEEEQELMAWLERRGYLRGRPQYDLLGRKAVEADSDGAGPGLLPLLERPNRDEVRFRMGEPQDREPLLSFFRRCFPGRWEYEALCYFEKGGTGREFVLAEKNGKIMGFCRINDSRSPLIAQNVYWAPLFAEELGGIGPLGIDPAERGQGYGRAVVEAGIYFLQQRGIRTICIDWTDLVGFYEKLGFQVWKRYQTYAKTVVEKQEKIPG
ncbi:GNAT family N-acetyltransferase [Brevibacillus ruminantium]|uniref:GNAT family N-acetyltransferase n=1 Tax=Brevibacillus ruminantium TaxID=2950604 RepID=A0ABY4WIE4_9BACL|nr:GNAT family N-acetyltransferase [Brevibacillus ruminantium]USG66915.1 GNAT family N-acetyltransferase [Brevibacillus ruminantium]